MRRKDRSAYLVCLEEPRSAISEAFRTMRTNIQFTSNKQEIRSLLVTSANPDEGKTMIISNLAISMAQANQRVLLIDADLRKSSLHYRFPINNRLGLTDILTRPIDLTEVVQTVPAIPGLHIVAAGITPPNPAELLCSKQMSDFLDEAVRQYDILLLDTPPLLPVTDAQVLARYVDGVLLVVNSGKVLREQVKKAKLLLDHVGGNVIGAILNNKKLDAADYYY